MANNTFRTISANFIEGVGTTRNYVRSSFESGTTNGWGLGTTGTLTNALPTGTPTFGSGAAGTLSFVASSSSFFLISGSSSGSLVSSAGTTPAGNMLHSDPLPIDPADRAKVLTFKFNYLFANAANCNLSGTSSNTFGVAVYDVTNSSWIPVNGAFNIVQSSGVGTASGTLQTNSTTASLRFCFYMANAASGIYSLGVDDFFLGPQTITTGAAMSDFKNDSANFTPNSFGTISNKSIFSRREGDSLRVRGTFQGTGGTASAASLTLSGYAIDNSGNKTVSTSGKNVVGEWYTSQTAASGSEITSSDNRGLLLVDSTTNTIYFARKETAGSFDYALGNVVMSGSGGVTSVEMLIPIQGWSSNVQQSSDSDQRTVAARYTSTSTATYTSTFADVTFGNKDFDTHAAFDGTNFKAPSSGIYSVTTSIAFAAGTSQGTIRLGVSKNGGSPSYVVIEKGGTVNAFSGAIYSGLFQCNAGDTLKVQAYQDMVGTLALIGVSDIQYVTFNKLSGSAVVQATESVYASYYGNATATGVPNNSTTTLSSTYLAYGKVADSHAAFNTTTGIFTCPSSGAYEVTGSVIFASNGTGIRDFIVTQSGSASFTLVTSVPGSANGATGATGSFIFKCNAGDTLAIQGYQNSGGALVIGNTCVFGIKRIGN